MDIIEQDFWDPIHTLPNKVNIAIFKFTILAQSLNYYLLETMTI